MSTPAQRTYPRTGMTRADYETIAAVLHDTPALDGQPLTRRALALDLAEALCAGNNRFNPLTFAQMVDPRVGRDEVVEWSHALRLRVEAQEHKRDTL